MKILISMKILIKKILKFDYINFKWKYENNKTINNAHIKLVCFYKNNISIVNFVSLVQNKVSIYDKQDFKN